MTSSGNDLEWCRATKVIAPPKNIATMTNKIVTVRRDDMCLWFSSGSETQNVFMNSNVHLEDSARFAPISSEVGCTPSMGVNLWGSSPLQEASV